MNKFIERISRRIKRTNSSIEDMQYLIISIIYSNGIELFQKALK